MGRKDFDGLSVVTDKKTAMTLAAMWVNEEHLAFMVKSRPPFRVVNEPMYQYMVKHGWVIPFGEPYTADKGTFQAMQVSHLGLTVVEFYLRQQRLAGKAARKGKRETLKQIKSMVCA